MSKITSFLSGNVGLVGGGIAATAVAVVALVASGVLGPTEEPQTEPVVLEEAAEVAPQPVQEETAAPTEATAPEVEVQPEAEVAVVTPQTEPEQEEAPVAEDAPSEEEASAEQEAPVETTEPAPTSVEEEAQEATTDVAENAEESVEDVAETVAEPVESAADAVPSAEETPTPVAPAFDLVRIEPDGSGQIAGTASAHGLIALLLDGVEIAQVQADGAGKFFTFIALGPNPQPRELLLVERLDAGDVRSDSAFLVAPIAAPVEVAKVEVPAADNEVVEEVASAVEEVVEDIVETVETSVEQVVEEVAETVSEPAEPTEPAEPVETVEVPEEPQAPAVLVSDADGVRVVQPATSSSAAEVASAVSIDAISYASTGGVVVAGRGLANGFVRLYLDNRLAQSGGVDGGGMWTLHLSEVEAGLYTMRVDEVDAAGKVLSRVETPFKRETPERVAEAQAQAQAEVETQNAQVEEPAEDQPVVETEQTAVAEEDLAEAASSTTGDDTNVAAVDVAGAESEIGEASSVAETTTETEVEPAPPAKQPAVRIVTVQPGSTLWAIARDRYGEGTMYVQVFEANKDKIRDPNLIYPGQVFTIPE